MHTLAINSTNRVMFGKRLDSQYKRGKIRGLLHHCRKLPHGGGRRLRDTESARRHGLTRQRARPGSVNQHRAAPRPEPTGGSVSFLIVRTSRYPAEAERHRGGCLIRRGSGDDGGWRFALSGIVQVRCGNRDYRLGRVSLSRPCVAEFLHKRSKKRQGRNEPCTEPRHSTS
jgi:hypothetical protein